MLILTSFTTTNQITKLNKNSNEVGKIIFNSTVSSNQINDYCIFTSLSEPFIIMFDVHYSNTCLIILCLRVEYNVIKLENN